MDILTRGAGPEVSILNYGNRAETGGNHSADSPSGHKVIVDYSRLQETTGPVQ